MSSTVSITEAQANLPKIARGKSVVGISNHQKVVGFYVPRERLEALLETMELLSNPAAMKVLREDRAGKLKYRPLSDCEKEWGLD